MRTGNGDGFKAGLIAAGSMLILLLVGGLYANIDTPMERFTDWLIPRIPMSWFETGIATLGGYAKPLLSIAVMAAMLLLGGTIGLVYGRVRARRANLTAVALLLAPGVLLLLSGALSGGISDSGALRTAVFYTLAYLLFAVVLMLVRYLQEPASFDDVTDRSRRRLLRRTLYGGGALLTVAGIGSVLVRLLDRVSLTNVRANVAGIPRPFTPADEFYVVSKNFVNPSVDRDSWRLSVRGLVDEPYELTLEQLRALPPVTQDQTLECISNEVGGNLISNAHWKGVPLRDLLNRAGVRAGTVDIALRCADGYTESIPLHKAMEPDVVLAYEMNGELLTDEHGAPARLLVPNIFGMKNAKWIERIEAANFDWKGFWQKQGWSDVATVQTMSQIRVPPQNLELTTGKTVDVGGIAFAGSRGIQKVDWSADGGRSWQEARLLPEIAPLSWRFWEASWTPDRPGDMTLSVRATDGDGNVQTESRTDTLPDGATGYHKIDVRVRPASA